MKEDKSSQEIKFSKYQTLFSLVILIVIYEPINRMIRQGLQFGEAWCFIVSFIVVFYVFWNFIRLTILMIIGVPAIVLSKHGITTAQNRYTIAWKDIEEMNLVVTGGRGHSCSLVIDVKDPWKYISQIKNPVLRNYRWFAKDYGYKPFSISLSVVEGNEDDVFNAVEDYFHQHR